MRSLVRIASALRADGITRAREANARPRRTRRRADEDWRPGEHGTPGFQGFQDFQDLGAGAAARGGATPTDRPRCCAGVSCVMYMASRVPDAPAPSLSSARSPVAGMPPPHAPWHNEQHAAKAFGSVCDEQCATPNWQFDAPNFGVASSAWLESKSAGHAVNAAERQIVETRHAGRTANHQDTKQPKPASRPTSSKSTAPSARALLGLLERIAATIEKAQNIREKLKENNDNPSTIDDLSAVIYGLVPYARRVSSRIQHADLDTDA